MLADYVLALLRSESSEGQQHGKEEQSGRAALRARVVENLEDFLKSSMSLRVLLFALLFLSLIVLVLSLDVLFSLCLR